MHLGRWGVSCRRCENCNRCCARVCGGSSCRGPGGVELCHEFSVGGSGGGEVLVAFFELEPQIDGVLFEGADLLFEPVDVVGDAKPGLVPWLFAEHFGRLPEFNDMERSPKE